MCSFETEQAAAQHADGGVVSHGWGPLSVWRERLSSTPYLGQQLKKVSKHLFSTSQMQIHFKTKKDLIRPKKVNIFIYPALTKNKTVLKAAAFKEQVIQGN